jgi:hypothetical protein
MIEMGHMQVELVLTCQAAKDMQETKRVGTPGHSDDDYCTTRQEPVALNALPNLVYEVNH